MVANKKRLYVALYPSGKASSEERRYHWAFLVGPKKENDLHPAGTKYHVRNPPSNTWIYEEAQVADVRGETLLLGRILLAKIEDEASLVNIFRDIPLVQNDPNWRCRTWIANVLSKIKDAGNVVGSAQLDWNNIERIARDYVASKTANGRYSGDQDMTLPKPTWDMLQSREVIS